MPLIRLLTRALARLTGNAPAERSPRTKRAVDAETAGLVLYHLTTCPFCVPVRWVIRRLGLSIEMRNTRRRANRNELIRGGGSDQVPCLRIGGAQGKVRWLYESQDIILYLRQRFGER